MSDIFFQRRNDPTNVVRAETQITTEGSETCPTVFLREAEIYMVYQSGTGIAVRHTQNIFPLTDTINWSSKTMAITNASMPFIALDEANKWLHLSYWNSSTIYSARSNDNGSTYFNGNGTAVTQGSQGTVIASSVTAEQQASLVVDELSGNLLCTYEDNSGTIQVMRSRDFGASWVQL